jgi:hypothetical protein
MNPEHREASKGQRRKEGFAPLTIASTAPGCYLISDREHPDLLFRYFDADAAQAAGKATASIYQDKIMQHATYRQAAWHYYTTLMDAFIAAERAQAVNAKCKLTVMEVSYCNEVNHLVEAMAATESLAPYRKKAATRTTREDFKKESVDSAKRQRVGASLYTPTTTAVAPIDASAFGGDSVMHADVDHENAEARTKADPRNAYDRILNDDGGWYEITTAMLRCAPTLSAAAKLLEAVRKRNMPKFVAFFDSERLRAKNAAAHDFPDALEDTNSRRLGFGGLMDEVVVQLLSRVDFSSPLISPEAELKALATIARMAPNQGAGAGLVTIILANDRYLYISFTIQSISTSIFFLLNLRFHILQYDLLQSKLS